MNKYNLLGVGVDGLTMKQAVDQIAATAKNPKSPAVYVVKPYVEFIDTAYKRPAIAQLLNEAELCLPDGTALAWGTHYLYGGRQNLARLFGTLIKIVVFPRGILKPLPEIFRGVDFSEKLIARCAEDSLKVFFIGSPKRSNIDATAGFLKQKYSKLKIVGHFTGQLNPELELELIQTLKTAGADVILVGMGFPRQERLMSHLKNELKHGVLVGEGGTFDYQQFGGRIKRAPNSIRAIGLEWLWRLGREPFRLRRQLAIPRFIYYVYLAGRRTGS